MFACQRQNKRHEHSEIEKDDLNGKEVSLVEFLIDEQLIDVRQIGKGEDDDPNKQKISASLFQERGC